MPKIEREDDRKHGDPKEYRTQRPGGSSPPGKRGEGASKAESAQRPDDDDAHEGRGEDGAADLQPNDVENGDTAR
jgi:hypothetical protein